MLRFDRAADGSLSFPAGTAGCITLNPHRGCATGRLLDQPRTIEVSPDGANVYVTSTRPDGAVVVLDRAADGALTQRADSGACLSAYAIAGCTFVPNLGQPMGAAVSPDGTAVYVTSHSPEGAVFSFDRAADGSLALRPGPTGCYADAPMGACAVTPALSHAYDAAVAGDGRTVYVVARDSNAIAVFDRVPARADLSVQVTPSLGSVHEGEQVTYAAVVANAGPDAVTQTQLTVVLDASLTYQPAASSPGCRAVSGHEIRCTGTVLAAGASRTIPIAARALQTGSAQSAFTVSGSHDELAPANDSVTATTTVRPKANPDPVTPDPGVVRRARLVVSLAGAQRVVTGRSTRLVVGVRNHGNGAARNARVRITLPRGVQLRTSGTTRGCTTRAARFVTCRITRLAARARRTLHLNVRGTHTTRSTWHATTNNTTTRRRTFTVTCPRGTSPGVRCTLRNRGGGLLIHGTPRADRIYGSPGNDIIYGGPGHDRINGGPGTNTISWENGNSTTT